MNELKNSNKVLIAEKDKFSSIFLSLFFIINDYDVIVAYDPINIIKYVQNNFFQLIIIDISLINSDTCEIIELLKNFDHNLPIIIVTKNSFTDTELIKKIRMAGVFYHITKPFDFDELKKIIQIFSKKEMINYEKHRQNFNN